jgi:hypothetical protein
MLAVEDPHLMLVVAAAGDRSCGNRLFNAGDFSRRERDVECIQ